MDADPRAVVEGIFERVQNRIVIGRFGQVPWRQRFIWIS
jgi:hypothetical protein